MRDCFVGVESLRNGYDYVGNQLVPWIQSNKAYSTEPFRLFHMDGEAFPVAESQLWQALGAEGSWLDELLEVRPCRCEGKLVVSANLEGAHSVTKGEPSFPYSLEILHYFSNVLAIAV